MVVGVGCWCWCLCLFQGLCLLLVLWLGSGFLGGFCCFWINLMFFFVGFGVVVRGLWVEIMGFCLFLCVWKEGTSGFYYL